MIRAHQFVSSYAPSMIRTTVFSSTTSEKQDHSRLQDDKAINPTLTVFIQIPAFNGAPFAIGLEPRLRQGAEAHSLKY